MLNNVRLKQVQMARHPGWIPIAPNIHGDKLFASFSSRRKIILNAAFDWLKIEIGNIINKIVELRAAQRRTNFNMFVQVCSYLVG